MTDRQIEGATDRQAGRLTVADTAENNKRLQPSSPSTSRYL